MANQVVTAQFDGVKVFSATKHSDRDRLGDTISEWLRAQRGIEVVSTVVTQSSDSEFHCLAITLFFKKAA
jgi:hypothetical protein